MREEHFSERRRRFGRLFDGLIYWSVIGAGLAVFMRAVLLCADAPDRYGFLTLLSGTCYAVCILLLARIVRLVQRKQQRLNS